MVKGKLNIRASLAAVGIGFWLTMAGGVSAGPGGGERIVGGALADPADWPFIAAVTSRGGQQFCGGSVLDADSVVTAAHCVYGSRTGDVHVITGRPDLGDESVGRERKVSAIKVHQRYRREGSRDIAIVTLKHPTDSPAVLLPTPAEEELETAAGEELRVAGWGGTKRAGGAPSDVLMDVPLFAISDKECGTHFSFFRPDEEVCAFGEPQGGNKFDDSCFGDSGGPLVADSPRGALLVGLVSYGGPRCGVDQPGVYAQIAVNLRFIKRHAYLP